MDDFCFQLVKLVRALRDVDGPLAECLATVARIGPGNGEDWYREWRVQADACRARADAELAHGYHQTAKSNWLQASVYYRTAGAFLSADDERNWDLLSAAENCSDNYMRSMQPAGEIVDMPCGGRRTIRGYFLRAPHSLRRSPVVVCFGGTGETKDELLGTMPRFAFARGLSLLIVDDQGGSRDRAGDRSRRNIEKAVGRCVDYLSGRDDVDRNRIALFGNNFGAIHASRIASLDHRFAAVVCDGGIWEERGRPLLSSWAVGGHVPKLPRYAMARRLKCPFLVTSGDYEFLDPEAATRLHEYSIKAKLQMELRLFSSTDAGSPRRAFIFDWLATKIAEDVSRGSAEQSFHLPRAARSGKRPREH